MKAIITESRSWIGTRFKHQGRIKYECCDCLGLLLGLNIYTKTGDALKSHDVTNYPKLIESNILLEHLDRLLEKTETIRPGNLLLIRVNNWPQHLAIVTEVDPHIIIVHAYVQARKVVEQHLPEEWKKNIVAMYEVAASSSTRRLAP